MNPSRPINKATRFAMNGIFVIDKPAGLTSHDVVNRVRRILNLRSVGHLGTLDPLATGVLPLVVGNLTRLAQFYTGSEKCYEGTIRFGFSTDTYDSDGDPSSEPAVINLSLDDVKTLAAPFLGTIEQMPPPFSAKKIKGVPAYKLARKNRDVPLKAVQVKVEELEIFSCQGDLAIFRARVSSGTYIRSIAHDMGRAAGCGAHLATLRRTMSGRVHAGRRTHARRAGGCESRGSARRYLHPSQKASPSFPAVAANEEQAARIRSGQSVNLPELSRARQVKVFQGQRDLIAIATRIAGTLFHPGIVFVSQGQPTPAAK